MKIKIITLLTILLLICSCQKNSSLERVKIGNDGNIILQKENLYGKWKLQNISIFDRDLLIHTYSRIGNISFDDNYLNICIEDKCSKLPYKIENNNLKVDNDGSIPTENISAILNELDKPILSLSYSINELKYTYVYELEN